MQRGHDKSKPGRLRQVRGPADHPLICHVNHGGTWYCMYHPGVCVLWHSRMRTLQNAFERLLMKSGSAMDMSCFNLWDFSTSKVATPMKYLSRKRLIYRRLSSAMRSPVCQLIFLYEEGIKLVSSRPSRHSIMYLASRILRGIPPPPPRSTRRRNGSGPPARLKDMGRALGAA